MGGISSRNARTVLCAVAMAMVAFQALGASQGGGGRFGDVASLTYTHGQSIEPVFHGWLSNADGTFDLYFSYVNRNWQEELDIPVGPDNNIQPAPLGPDGGQPTHFYPRVNRWMFAVRVPEDFGSKEVVWSLTAHGQTHRAYGTLEPGYVVDEFLIMHEYGGNQRGLLVPTLQVEGERQRTASVGQSVPLIAVATDRNAPLRPPEAAAEADVRIEEQKTGVQVVDRQAPARENFPTCGAVFDPGSMGGDLVRCTARGLRLAWLVYRGPAAQVTFDPPIPFKVWEDQRGGSPWSPGWRPPPIPPGNKWIHNVTFQEPGTYVLRAQAHDGFKFKNEDITFTVTP